MREFSWTCFEATGSIDAYLLYRDMHMHPNEQKPDSLVEEMGEEEK